MRKILLGVLLCSFLWQAGTSQGQGTGPIDVFLGYDREARTVTVYFANGVTGLSATLLIIFRRNSIC
jgi:hypothetical protein